jgi:hypothetical protein
MTQTPIFNLINDLILEEHIKKTFKNVNLHSYEFLDKFGETFTMSAIMRLGGSSAAKKQCDKGEIIWITTKDKGDNQGISHKVDVIKVADMLTNIRLYDTLYSANLTSVLQEKLKQRKDNNERIVVNCLIGIGKLTLGHVRCPNDIYHHISFI